MTSKAFLSLLQFSDGLFPVGSYAHSFGLETYVADGSIRYAEDIQAFLLSYLEGSVAPTDAVAAVAARNAAHAQPSARMDQCIDVDRLLDVTKTAAELRAASRQMGRQVMRIAVSLGGPFVLDGLTADLLRAVETDEIPGHHAMAFGVAAAALRWREAELSRAYLYSTCAGIISAALRLLPLGQVAGQRILWALIPHIDILAEEVQGKTTNDIWNFVPGIEIASMRHANLDARLFRS
jgi:urease accessory protein